MRWILVGLLLVSFHAIAIPDEILTNYLERHEICVKDARIRAPDKEAFTKLKEQCRLDYVRMVEGGFNSDRIVKDDSPPVRRWTRFVTETKTMPEFELRSVRHYIFSKNQAQLGEFYITRDKNFPERFVLWNNGVMIYDYNTVPLSNALYNAKYSNGRIAIYGLDSDMTYYVVIDGKSYHMETEFGHVLKLNAALYLANNALIVYNGVPIGTISRNVAKEID